MDNVMGKPNALKQVNLSLVRKAIKEKGSATRSEIVEQTKISVTTIRTLLSEMLENNEIVADSYDDSIGGRKAVRYKLNKNRFFGVALCLHGNDINYLIINICGEVHTYGKVSSKGNISESILAFLDDLIKKFEIKSIGIGVPGIVNGLGYHKKNAEGQLIHYPLGEEVAQRYKVPVCLENDLNAITLGFGRSYLKMHPEVECQKMNISYLHFGKNCLSAGFLCDGKLIRGWHNFVGELGLFPIDNARTLDDLMQSPLENKQYIEIVTKLLAGICCVLNPQYIAIGGPSFKEECLPAIMQNIQNKLPDIMSAQIKYVDNEWQHYSEGMAYLSAEQIFANVLLLKE